MRAGATTTEIASWYALVLSTTRTDAEHGQLARDQAGRAPELRTAADGFAAELPASRSSPPMPTRRSPVG